MDEDEKKRVRIWKKAIQILTGREESESEELAKSVVEFIDSDEDDGADEFTKKTTSILSESVSHDGEDRILG